jgi:ATP-dependent RNA helicase RhlE
LNSDTAPHRLAGGRRPPRRGPRNHSSYRSAARPPVPEAPRPQAPYDPAPVPFETLGLNPLLLQGVRDRGFELTTPIQSAVIPIALAGHDLIGCAETGTGKTAAFLLPILHRLLAAPPPPAPRSRVLILSPTRELAVQIEDDVQGFAYHTHLSSMAVFGGVAMDAQERALRAGVDIIVATPGRLMDHMRAEAAQLGGIEVFVLDEADRMMDMGFWPDVRRIAAALPPAPRQTLLFSATIPDEVMRLVGEVVREPRYVQIGSSGAPASTITHIVERVASAQKPEWLAAFLRRTAGPVLVFVRTKQGAERLARRLAASGVRAAALHADRTQQERLAAVEGFRSGRHRVVVATDVAARGLDIEGISHVVNYEVPTSRDAYVHRVGRTGRAEATGIALTLAAPEELRALQVLEQTFGLRL